MYHQVEIIKQDRAAQSFLWRAMYDGQEPNAYEMQVAIFGTIVTGIRQLRDTQNKRRTRLETKEERVRLANTHAKKKMAEGCQKSASRRSGRDERAWHNEKSLDLAQVTAPASCQDPTSERAPCDSSQRMERPTRPVTKVAVLQEAVQQ